MSHNEENSAETQDSTGAFARIYAAAKVIPEQAEQEAFVRNACNGNESLVAKILAELSSADATQGHSPSSSTARSSAVAGEGTSKSKGVSDKYKLIQKIGEGGMGTVWLAEQTKPVRRAVALKLIRSGSDSKAVLARFEAERQALALMDHPNVARILDGGLTQSGVPFFVMELIRGVPINEYCNNHNLTIRERLELFIPVCQAIQHAHQKGIIHRDIKPSNVLVTTYDGKPVPKVIDFGVAKATGGALTEKTLVTGFAVVGTPQYMSPEQATLNQLDIDTRSDVYSLGVLLYELLSGSPPFQLDELKKAGYLEILRIVREEEPPRPSAKISTAKGLPQIAAQRKAEPKSLAATLRQELDWLVMKALEKDRSRRYSSPNDFALDVQRYLAGETIDAHPPSRIYRLKKYVFKYRIAVTAVAITTLALVSSVVASGLAWRDANTQRLSAEEANKETRQLNLQLVQEKTTAIEAKNRAEQAEKDVRHRLYVQNVRYTKDLALQDDFSAAKLTLREVFGKDFESLHGFEYKLLKALLYADGKEIACTGASDNYAFSREGDRFVILDNKNFYIYDTKSWALLDTIDLTEVATKENGHDNRLFSNSFALGRTWLNSKGTKACLVSRDEQGWSCTVIDLLSKKVQEDARNKIYFFGPDDSLFHVTEAAQGGFLLRGDSGNEIEIPYGGNQNVSRSRVFPRIIDCTNESILMNCSPEVMEVKTNLKELSRKVRYDRGFFAVNWLPHAGAVVLSPNQFQFQTSVPRVVFDLHTGSYLGSLSLDTTIIENPAQAKDSILITVASQKPLHIGDAYNALLGPSKKLLEHAIGIGEKREFTRMVVPVESFNCTIDSSGDRLVSVRQDRDGSHFVAMPFPPTKCIEEFSLPEQLGECLFVPPIDVPGTFDSLAIVKNETSVPGLNPVYKVVGFLEREDKEYKVRQIEFDFQLRQAVQYVSRKNLIVGLSNQANEVVAINAVTLQQYTAPVSVATNVIAIDGSGDVLAVASGKSIDVYSLPELHLIRSVKSNELQGNVVQMVMDARGENIYVTDNLISNWRDQIRNLRVCKISLKEPYTEVMRVLDYSREQMGNVVRLRGDDRICFANLLMAPGTLDVDRKFDVEPQSISPDGKRIVVRTSSTKRWSVVEASRYDEVFQIDNSSEVRAAYFLPNGQLAVVYANSIMLLGDESTNR